ncbi:helix-turn-helix transcriptional regulator [Ktedonobacter robiniae]|uniref:helix-turn-helix transcriptional regulator n=1 Tax=Ktedonobacter robiniae TaxID=2778365 RepID=UPI0019154FB2|nr:helix-turn-helix transcriptional regulator [Ktedonobacter robiniae]
MTKTVKRHAGLSDFLKSRRARLRPEEFGLPTYPRRRARGLTREELAQLIGVGVDWYTWLEQGRDIRVSDQVLDRLASTLQLNEEERRHLFLLARDAVSSSTAPHQARDIQRATYQTILDGIVYPARLLDRRHMTLIACNESAKQIFGDIASRSEWERNSTWFVLMHPSSRDMLVYWERAARRSIALLHANYDQHPEDPWLRELIADLHASSPEFRAWWPEHEILLSCQGLDEIQHPLVGRLAFQPTILAVPSQPNLQIVVYTPLPQVDTAAKLRTLLRSEPILRA